MTIDYQLDRLLCFWGYRLDMSAMLLIGSTLLWQWSTGLALLEWLTSVDGLFTAALTVCSIILLLNYRILKHRIVTKSC